MNSRYTFIMNSEEIGETIDQYVAHDLNEAWKSWSADAADWIVNQKEYSAFKTEEVISEILSTSPQQLADLHLVWMADFCLDLSLAVIQVIVVSCPLVD